MNDKVINTTLLYLCVAIGLGLCLFGATTFILCDCFFSPMISKHVAGIVNPATQWLTLLFVCFYFSAFIVIPSRPDGRLFRWPCLSTVFLTGTMIIGILVYACNYETASQSEQMLILIAGATFGQGILLWSVWRKQKYGSCLTSLILNVLMVLFCASSLWHADIRHQFTYQGHVRWTGPWDNPNAFGLLMGTGIVLTIGSTALSVRLLILSKRVITSWHMKMKQSGLVMLFLFMVTLMTCGLLYSYSRGAWVATICGLIYLATGRKSRNFAFSRSIHANALSVVLIAFSILVLATPHFLESNCVLRRAFSAVNVDDFSWRNRVATWEGALQITEEHPWFGAGWNRPEVLYNHYYIPFKMDEGAAIRMNDYLLLCATLGVPSLFCFVAFIWLALFRKPECGTHNPASLMTEWLKAVCRGGAIVLLVGFCLDGGLFKLSTAVTFWTLLVLGGASPVASPIWDCQRPPNAQRQVVLPLAM